MSITEKRIHSSNVNVPLKTLMKLPSQNKVVGCIEQQNIFNDNKPEPALIVVWRDGREVRKGLFTVADGTYIGEY